MRFAQKYRQQRQDQQHDQPRRVEDQPRAEADHRHDVLKLAEQLRHQRHAPARLPPRPLQLVLERGILEILEVQRCGVFHQADARRVADLVAQQPVDQRHHPRQHIRHYRQREFRQQKEDKAGHQPAG